MPFHACQDLCALQIMFDAARLVMQRRQHKAGMLDPQRTKMLTVRKKSLCLVIVLYYFTSTIAITARTHRMILVVILRA
jgi:hypothetical protein